MIVATRDMPSLYELIEMKFFWVRQVMRPWVATLRDPTVGTLLEFLEVKDIDCVRIDSLEAAKLYKRLCF